MKTKIQENFAARFTWKCNLPVIVDAEKFPESEKN